MNTHVYEEEEYAELIRPVMIFGKLIAVWPIDENSGEVIAVLRKFHFIFILILFGVTSFGITCDVVHNMDNMEEATECALIGSAFYLACLRVIVYTIHGKDLLYVVNTIRDDWIQSTYEDRMVFKQNTIYAYQLCKYFITGVAMTILLFMCVPSLEVFVFNGERVLPFRGYFFINHTVSPIFECLYIFNVSAGGFGGCTIAAATSFNFIAMTHGAAKFAALRRKLEALNGEDPDAEIILGNCVSEHKEAIRFADALERIINFLALGQFIISTGLLCFAGFQISAMIEDKGRLMKYVAFLNCAIFELFMFSFSGDGLMEESAAVGQSAYSSGWIGSRLPQSLQIMMMRCNTPCKITAGKFYSMSLESFSTVLSTSFSYFTVLTAMNED